MIAFYRLIVLVVLISVATGTDIKGINKNRKTSKTKHRILGLKKRVLTQKLVTTTKHPKIRITRTIGKAPGKPIFTNTEASRACVYKYMIGHKTVYIGQSKNCHDRMLSHKNAMRGYLPLFKGLMRSKKSLNSIIDLNGGKRIKSDLCIALRYGFDLDNIRVRYAYKYKMASGTISSVILKMDEFERSLIHSHGRYGLCNNDMNSHFQNAGLHGGV